MKTIFTSLLLFVLVALNAQNEFFVHKATVENISTNATFIDHPYLNNNPSAYFVISHAWNPPGGSSVYNNKVSGLYYSVGESKWTIYNQDASNFIPDTSFFVYIPVEGYGTEFVATDANTDGFYAFLDYSGTNGEPDAVIVVNPIYTTYIDKNVGLWYDGSRWALYNEDGVTGMTVGQKFMVSMAGSNQVAYKHQATASNISSNWTIIDHPLLNNKPNAKFVFTHNWGAAGDSSNILYDKVTGAWYDGTRWCIYNEDSTPFVENVVFNIVIEDSTMSIEDVELTKTTAYPNPMVNHVNFSSQNKIEEIRIYNLAGQEVISSKSNTNTVQLNVSNLPSGVYVAVVKTNKGVETTKLVKK